MPRRSTEWRPTLRGVELWFEPADLAKGGWNTAFGTTNLPAQVPPLSRTCRCDSATVVSQTFRNLRAESSSTHEGTSFDTGRHKNVALDKVKSRYGRTSYKGGRGLEESPSVQSVNV